MSSPFAMDQSEKVGLGAAVGGHALLLALLVFGLYRAATPMGSDGGGSGDGIAVEIVSEGAAAPEPAPIAIETDQVTEPVPEPISETMVDPDPIIEPVKKVQPIPKPLKQAAVKPQPKAIQKPVPKPVQKPIQKVVKSGSGNGGSKTEFEKQMEKKLGGLGGGGTGTAPDKGKGEGAGKGESIKTAGQISKEVNAVLGPKILRYIRQCAPSGVDVNRIITTVTINLFSNGGVNSLTGVSQRGITDNNRAQAQPMERCVTGAIRKAAPFTELNAKDYDGWKTHRMSFQPN